MKYIMLGAILCLLLFLPIATMNGGNITLQLVEAKGLVPCGGAGEPLCNACHFISMVNGLIQYLFTIITLLVVLMIVYSGFQLVISQGDPGAWTKAKSMFTNVVIGFVIILSAWLVVDTLMKALVDSKAGLGMWNSLEGECK